VFLKTELTDELARIQISAVSQWPHKSRGAKNISSHTWLE